MMKTPFLRSLYNYDRDVASDESGLACDDPTLAQQQFRDEADINTILERFGRTGEVVVPVRAPQFGDYSEVTDYHAAMNMIIEAQNAFDALPARLRKQFDNDPGRFVDFVMDDSNRDKAIEMGLIAREAIVTMADVAAESSVKAAEGSA
jgi:phage internal scaffolding protein